MSDRLERFKRIRRKPLSIEREQRIMKAAQSVAMGLPVGALTVVRAFNDPRRVLLVLKTSEYVRAMVAVHGVRAMQH